MKLQKHAFPIKQITLVEVFELQDYNFHIFDRNIKISLRLMVEIAGMHCSKARAAAEETVF